MAQDGSMGPLRGFPDGPRGHQEFPQEGPKRPTSLTPQGFQQSLAFAPCWHSDGPRRPKRPLRRRPPKRPRYSSRRPCNAPGEPQVGSQRPQRRFPTVSDGPGTP
eukprot:6502178-Pyramimonas_sp.AAC.1